MKIVIKAKKKMRSLLHLLLCLLLIVISINALIETKSMKLVLNGLFNYIVFGIGLAYSIFFLIQSFMVGGKEWFGKNAELMITNDKLTNKLNYYSSGEVLIKEIVKVEVLYTNRYKFLAFTLQNVSKFISEKSFLQRKILKKVFKKFGTPLIITEGSLECDLNELKNIIDAIKKDSLERKSNP